MTNKLKRVFEKIKSVPALGKSILLLVLAVIIFSVTTFAWFTLGSPGLDVGQGTIVKYPNGVAVIFENNGEAIGANTIEIENLLPQTSAEFIVRVKKPVGTTLKFSLKFGKMSCEPSDKNLIFDLFYIRHSFTGTQYEKQMSLIEKEDYGYFLVNYDKMDAGATEVEYKFEIYFDDRHLPEGVGINEFQGVSITIETMEMEVIYD